MRPVRKIAVVASASGNGKTTLAGALAQILDVQLVELDALVHGPDWAQTPDDVLRTKLEPIIASDGWVIDGVYAHKLGDLVLDAADAVIWLDLPVHIWLPRLARRTWRRMRRREELWNGNRESLRNALWGRDALFAWALRSHFRHRREWPQGLGDRRVIRLRSPAEVDRFLTDARAGL
jgi:adenylate kinase family enzyme